MTEQTTNYELTVPIEFGRDHISTLTFRSPVARDFRRMGASGPTTIGDLLDFASVLCAQPPAVLDKMGVQDMAGVLTIVANFIQAGLGTQTPS